MKSIVCIPTYNERGTIGRLIEEILSVSKEWENRLHILVIDDNSPDGTSNIVEKYIDDNDNIFLKVREEKLGLGTAIQEGLRFSFRRGYDAMVLMDADLQHSPYYIPQLLKMIYKGFDLVIASRYVRGGGIEGWGVIRRQVSRGANTYAKLLLNLPFYDLTSGFRSFSPKAMRFLKDYSFISEGYALQVETAYVLYINGFKITEVPFIFRSRIFGKSKLGVRDISEYFLTIMKLRWVR